ncbi:MAG: hypothetical protein ACR2GK_02770 [Gemmatimonadaceae bacterium]
MSDRAIAIDDRETIVVGGTISAVVLGVVYCFARIGLESHVPDVLRALGLSLFMIAIPYWLWRALRRSNSDFIWNRSQPFLTLATITFTAIVAFAFGPLAGGIGFAGSVIGAVAAVIVLFSWLRNGALRSRILFTLGTVVVSKWAAGIVWTSRYKMPQYWEVLSSSANVHHDPLYYVAMGNMLRVYGVPSTGLDGIPYAFYHYGTAWLFHRWADLAETDLLSFYSLGYALILIPLFFASIAMLAIEVRKASLLSRPQGWLRTNWWGWLALAIGTIGIIPDSALYSMAVWNAHVLISESYLGGLPVFLMATATAVIAWRAEKRSVAFMLVFLPVILVALAFLKVSLMILLFAMVIYVLFRTRLLFTVHGAASAVVMFAAGYLSYMAVSLPAHNAGFDLLHFMRYSTAPGWHQFFPLVHFAWTWVYAAGRIYEERIADLAGLRDAVKARSIIDVEILLGVSLLAFLPGQLISIHGGSAIYFSDVPRWLALALVMARAGHWVGLWRERQSGAEFTPRALRPAHLLLLFVAAPFAVTMALNTIKPPLRMLRQNIFFRSELVSQAGLESRLAAGERSLLFDPDALNSGVEAGEYYVLVESLREIGRIPAEEKNDMLLFIPQSYDLYWRMFDPDDRCTYVGLIAPAVAGMALLDGMPPFGCEVTDQYNMHSYVPREREQVAADLTITALCSRAARKGFRRVMVFAPDSQGMPSRRVAECVT